MACQAFLEGVGEQAAARAIGEPREAISVLKNIIGNEHRCFHAPSITTRKRGQVEVLARADGLPDWSRGRLQAVPTEPGDVKSPLQNRAARLAGDGFGDVLIPHGGAAVEEAAGG